MHSQSSSHAVRRTAHKIRKSRDYSAPTPACTSCERSEHARFNAENLAFQRGHQAGVAAGRGGVDAGHALGREAGDVVGTAGLGPGPGQSLAAERLAFHHRADLVAVDVEIADA